MTMREQRRYFRAFVATALLTFAVPAAMMTQAACAKAPPNLTPVGVAAWNKLQVVHDLDLARDIAIAAEANGVIKTADARAVVTYHRSALRTVQAGEAGWKAAVSTGLDELSRDLSPEASQKLAPYIALLRAVLAGISS